MYYDYNKQVFKRGNQLNLENKNGDKSFSSLIELGTRGHFPLFFSSWLEELSDIDIPHLSDQDKIKINNIKSRLSQHKGIERKKTFLISLTKNERQIFIKSFFEEVEGEILSTGRDLQ